MEKRYQKKFQEMAHVGDVDQLKIDVYADHNPPHFHVTKKGEFEVRIGIVDLSIINYKWQKNGAEISSSELKSLQKWLGQPYPKNKKNTNKEVIAILWDTMN